MSIQSYGNSRTHGDQGHMEIKCAWRSKTHGDQVHLEIKHTSKTCEDSYTQGVDLPGGAGKSDKGKMEDQMERKRRFKDEENLYVFAFCPQR